MGKVPCGWCQYSLHHLAEKLSTGWEKSNISYICMVKYWDGLKHNFNESAFEESHVSSGTVTDDRAELPIAWYACTPFWFLCLR